MLTLAATLFASWAWGFTLNRVSLFALIFSIGILVDDAIVVVENIHRRARDGKRPLHGIIPDAVDEVGGPTILATFTVIAALLPMAFVTGLMGPYMSPIPINASMGMLISLAIAFTVTPWLALKLLHAHGAAHALRRSTAKLAAGFFRASSRPSSRRPRAARNRRAPRARHRSRSSCSRSGSPRCKLVVLKMLPFDNKSEFQVVVDMPAGTPLEDTAAVLHEMGARICDGAGGDRLPGLRRHRRADQLQRAGAPVLLRTLPEQGDMQVNLVDKHAAPPQEPRDRARVRPRAGGDRASAGTPRCKVVEVPPGPPVLSPIVAEIYGPD